MSARDIKNNLTAWEKRIRAGIFKLGEDCGMQMEGEAKRNAPWRDRTSNARNGLFGEAAEEENTLLVRISHTVEYGTYLELARHGKYRILKPTAENAAPEFFAAVRELIEK